ncbi:hypothetical protein unique for Leptomonas pyrrhocoris [Leishmania donovani]|nr:hypothetical protein unique for Leptomonas pyrrhocoris [Leishmania donovani]
MFRFAAPKCQAAAIAVCTMHVRYNSCKSPADVSEPKEDLSRPKGEHETPVRLPFCL